MSGIEYWFILLYLCLLSFFDLKHHKVPQILLTAGSLVAFFGAGYRIIYNHQSWWIYGMALLPGLFFLFAALLSGKIGYGDGWLLMNLGGLLGFRSCITIFLMSLLLISLVSIVLMLTRWVHKNSSIPYIPFLTVSVVIYNIAIHTLN